MFATFSKIFSPLISRVSVIEDISDQQNNNVMDSDSPAKENVNSVEAVVPKKRGRPKKIVQEVKSNSLIVAETGTSPVKAPAISSDQFYNNGEAAVSSSSDKEEKSDTEQPPVIAKKRGRPPKSANAAKKADSEKPQTASSVAKKRGRPKKNVDKASEASSPPKKSKAGPTQNGANSTEDTVSQVKRGRGRPKKIQA